MHPFCSHIPSQPETPQLWVVSEITAPAWHLHLLDGVHAPVPHTWLSILQHSLGSDLPCSLQLKDNSVPSHPSVHLSEFPIPSWLLRLVLKFSQNSVCCVSQTCLQPMVLLRDNGNFRQWGHVEGG